MAAIGRDTVLERQRDRNWSYYGGRTTSVLKVSQEYFPLHNHTQKAANILI